MYLLGLSEQHHYLAT